MLFIVLLLLTQLLIASTVKSEEAQDITTRPNNDDENTETTTYAGEVVENTETTAVDENATETTIGSEEHITSRRPIIIDYHREKAEKMYGFLSPIQISRKPKDLDEIYNCECPRVYWPMCGVDNITYVNACIANCLRVKIRRPGPCVLYRRR